LSESSCQLLVDEALDSLLQLLHCKLAVEDVVLSMTQEVTLYLLTVLLIQSDRVPESLEHSIEVITSIFHQPSAPTHTVSQSCSKIHTHHSHRIRLI
ncbi:hypothetical protein chiPu_0026068, partial [Chiloscyllium punctatum]|nr:hypothetical protein [Chiloscyllium punctatum]